MGLYKNIARLKEVKLYNIVLVPSRLSTSGQNKLHHHHYLYVTLFITSTYTDRNKGKQLLFKVYCFDIKQVALTGNNNNKVYFTRRH